MKYLFPFSSLGLPVWVSPLRHNLSRRAAVNVTRITPSSRTSFVVRIYQRGRAGLAATLFRGTTSHVDAQPLTSGRPSGPCSSRDGSNNVMPHATTGALSGQRNVARPVTVRAAPAIFQRSESQHPSREFFAHPSSMR